MLEYNGSTTTSDSKVDKGAASTTGAFTASITGLTANTTYYVRAYAISSAGVSYGDVVSFKTKDSPYISSVSSPVGGTYSIGQILDYTVNFSKAVNVVTASGTPYLTLNIGGSTVNAYYYAGTGSSALTFRYTVVSGDYDATGVAMVSNITLNGGTIKDDEGENATLTFSGSTAVNVLVDAVAPTITSVSAPASGTYAIGDVLQYTVTFSEDVTVSGSPYIEVAVGSSKIHAVYASGSQTTSLKYSYTVASGDYDADGIATGSNVVLNGGTINDAAGNDATLTFTAPSTSAVLVDAVAPTITSVSGPAAGTYAIGNVLQYTVTFSEDVTVSGSPYIEVTVGSSNRHAVYTSGSESSILTYSYTVASGDYDADGVASGSSVVLNSGTIKDAAGNDAILAFTAPTTSAVLVDAVAPTVVISSTTSESTSSSPIPVTITFSELVTGFEVDDITITNGTAANFSGNGTTYTVDITPIVQGSVSVDIAGSVAQDLAGNNNISATQLIRTFYIVPTVTFTTASQSSVDESGQMIITAQLSEATINTVTIPFTVNASSTASESDYSITASPLTISAGSTSADITITIANDALDEDDETVIVDMDTPTNATQGTTTSHTATITDDDAVPTVSFTAASQSSADESGTMTITAQLSAASGKTITVPFTVNGSSTATGSGVDYSITASPLTIPAGSTSADITITIASDELYENDETVIVDMGTPTNATQGTTTSHTATITDDDAAPTVSFTAASQSSVDESGTMTITAQLSAASGKTITVPFTVNGSSTATGSGVDYSITASPLTIPAGSTSADITITIANDVLDENDETVIVDMATPTNATQGTTTSHTATITDDDAMPVVSFISSNSSELESVSNFSLPISLSSESGLPVTVNYTVSGTATGGGTDYTLANGTLTINAGSTSGIITISDIVDDELVEDDETVVVTLSNPTNATLGTNTVYTYTITDNDEPSAPTVSFSSTSSSGAESVSSAVLQVNLSASSASNVTVDYTVSGTATGGGTDYTLANGTLTINAGSTSGTITISDIVDDELVEDDETVVVTLSNPTNATLGTNTVYTYTITDNDEPSVPTVSFSSTSSSGAESESSAVLQVNLSASSASNVTVDYTVSGTATGGGTDYTLANGTLTINAGSTSGTITISDIVDDELVEDDETVVVTLSNPTNATLGTNTVYTYTITDNDEPSVPTVSFSSTSSSGAESESSAVLQVNLSASSASNVTVDYTVSGTATGGGTDYTLANGTLTINAGSTSGTITISDIVDDELVEDDETVVVTLSNPTNATLGTNTVYTYTITDNDEPSVPTVSFSSTSSSGAESVSSAVLQVNLSASSASNVTVDYTVSGTATGGGTDYTLANGTLTINAGSTSGIITISDIVDDELVEDDETVVVTLSNPTNATLGTNTVYVYTIEDNDNPSDISDISKNKLSVYPNPFTNYVHLDNVGDDISQIIINDLSGRIVFSTDFKGEKDINGSHLKSGVYLLIIVKNNGEKQTVKIVKE
ncbi:MAG: Calx-beta domain-containing protein [Bacteroidales bacterium]